MGGLVGAVRRRAAAVLGWLLAPSDGVAPAGAGSRQPPIASMPESGGP